MEAAKNKANLRKSFVGGAPPNKLPSKRDDDLPHVPRNQFIEEIKSTITSGPGKKNVKQINTETEA